MSHTFIEYQNQSIRVYETPLIFSCLFLIKVNEDDFNRYFPNIKSAWFYQFKFNNWGGIDLELENFLVTQELRKNFVSMINETINFLNINTLSGNSDLTMIADFAVDLGMLEYRYPSYLLIEFLNKLNSLVE